MPLAAPKVVRLDQAETLSFGPNSIYRPLMVDETGELPIRTGVQVAAPGYATRPHSHPYVEILMVLEGTCEAWLEGQEDRPVRLGKGDAIALPAHAVHGFRTVGNETLRLLGTHLSPERIVNYVDEAP